MSHEWVASDHLPLPRPPKSLMLAKNVCIAHIVFHSHISSPFSCRRKWAAPGLPVSCPQSCPWSPPPARCPPCKSSTRRTSPGWPTPSWQPRPSSCRRAGCSRSSPRSYTPTPPWPLTRPSRSVLTPCLCSLLSLFYPQTFMMSESVAGRLAALHWFPHTPPHTVWPMGSEWIQRASKRIWKFETLSWAGLSLHVRCTHPICFRRNRAWERLSGISIL